MPRLTLQRIRARTKFLRRLWTEKDFQCLDRRLASLVSSWGEDARRQPEYDLMERVNAVLYACGPDRSSDYYQYTAAMLRDQFERVLGRIDCQQAIADFRQAAAELAAEFEKYVASQGGPPVRMVSSVYAGNIREHQRNYQEFMRVVQYIRESRGSSFLERVRWLVVIRGLSVALAVEIAQAEEDNKSGESDI